MCEQLRGGNKDTRRLLLPCGYLKDKKMIVRLHWQANFILRNLGCFENFVKFELYYGKVVANNWLSVWSQHFICMINRLNQPAILTIKKLRILSNVVLLGALWGLYTPVQSVHQNTERHYLIMLDVFCPQTQSTYISNSQTNHGLLLKY